MTNENKTEGKKRTNENQTKRNEKDQKKTKERGNLVFGARASPLATGPDERCPSRGGDGFQTIYRGCREILFVRGSSRFLFCPSLPISFVQGIFLSLSLFPFFVSSLLSPSFNEYYTDLIVFFLFVPPFLSLSFAEYSIDLVAHFPLSLFLLISFTFC